MARKRYIRILRGESLADFELVPGEMGIETGEDGLSVKLYVGTKFGKKLIGADINSDWFIELINNISISEEMTEKIEGAIQSSKIGNGLISVGADGIALGTPSNITATSTNSVSANSHTHLLAGNSVTNAKMAIMPSNTIKGAIGSGNPVDLTVAQVRAMLNISNVPNVDTTDASNITKGILSIERISNNSITLNKLDQTIIDMMGAAGDEIDPTVADWARKPNSKPSYTIDEITGGVSYNQFNDFRNETYSLINNVAGVTPTWTNNILSFIDGDGNPLDIDIDFNPFIMSISYQPLSNSLFISRYDGSASLVSLAGGSGSGSYVGSEGEVIDIIIDNNTIYGWLRPGSLQIEHFSSELRAELENITNTYVLPPTGIPATDLDISVRNRLVPTGGTALQYLRKNSTNTAMEWATMADILHNAALTGVPTAPTAASGTSTTQLATTAFVQSAITANGGFVVSNIAPANTNVLWIRTGAAATYGNGILHYHNGTNWLPVTAPWYG